MFFRFGELIFLIFFFVGITHEADPANDSFPKFHVKPVTAYGDGISGQEGTRLSGEGSFLALY